MKKNIFLKELKRKDVTNKYVQWMNDQKVMKYSDQRLRKHTINNIIKYVDDRRKSKKEFLYGIYLKNYKNVEHIGNIKLCRINFKDGHGDISYFIGNKDCWGKNYCTKAISEIIKIAKNKFKLKKLEAGCNELNVASEKVLKKNNFKKEGILRSHLSFNSKRYNSHLYGLILK
jgi:RimJ/RimL family protein N-acetyltransferase|tara:strand:- start:408 stop:926 length:519 start_codon:yes stop_codon:yes gene_type:complete